MNVPRMNIVDYCAHARPLMQTRLRSLSSRVDACFIVHHRRDTCNKCVGHVRANLNERDFELIDDNASGTRCMHASRICIFRFKFHFLELAVSVSEAFCYVLEDLQTIILDFNFRLKNINQLINTFCRRRIHTHIDAMHIKNTQAYMKKKNIT